MLDTIYFNGGSVRGIGYIGCLQYLMKEGLLENIKTMRGTSMGGLVLAFYLIGYKPTDMIKKLLNSNLTSIFDIELRNAFNRSSILKGKGIEKFIKKFMKYKKCKDITFLELYNKTGIHFTVTGSELLKYNCVNFNHETEPDMKVLTALRITSAIPFVFPPIRYKDGLYTDGCLFDMFNQNYKQDSLLYVTLESSEIDTSNGTPVHIFASLVLGGVVNYLDNVMRQNCNNSLILQINRKISNVDFNIDNDTIVTLFNQGYNSTLSYFDEKKSQENIS